MDDRRSPLRARAARHHQHGVAFLYRSPPARPVRTRSPRRWTTTAPVTPCAPGPHALPSALDDDRAGHPLRARAAHPGRVRRGARRRSPPARPGRTGPEGPGCCSGSVTPCAPGPHDDLTPFVGLPHGHPLRARAAPGLREGRNRVGRSPPARPGRTGNRPAGGQSETVTPCAPGPHGLGDLWLPRRFGHPLRARAARLVRLEHRVRVRSPPARPGRTLPDLRR